MISLRATALVCTAGILLVGGEWWSVRASVRAAAIGPPATHAIPRPPTLTQAATPTPDLERMVATSLARPLFSRTRRPNVAQAAATTPHESSLPRLSGIVVLPGFRRAIFEARGAGKPSVTAVAETGAIGDWTVQGIAMRTVTLVRDGQIMVLAPSAGTVAVPPPPPPRKLSRWEAPADHGMLRARWSNPQLQPRRRGPVEQTRRTTAWPRRRNLRPS